MIVSSSVASATSSRSPSPPLPSAKAMRVQLLQIVSCGAGRLTTTTTTPSANRVHQWLRIGDRKRSETETQRPDSFIASLPSNWMPMELTLIYLQAEVLPSDPDYSNARFLFSVAGALHHIYRIQNPTLFAQFVAEKSKMQQLYANHHWGIDQLPLNERLLFHGTKRDNVQEINTNGFDRSYTNAASLGFGCYFARDMRYSAGLRFSPPDAAGHKYVYVARVLVGVSCTAGTLRVDRPPKQPNGLSFDSVVDHLENPWTFVIFRDTRAYPLYLYEFSESPKL